MAVFINCYCAISFAQIDEIYDAVMLLRKRRMLLMFNVLLFRSKKRVLQLLMVSTLNCNIFSRALEEKSREKLTPSCFIRARSFDPC